MFSSSIIAGLVKGESNLIITLFRKAARTLLFYLSSVGIQSFMKILLMRHGEAMDDITNSYGGWADDPLTEKGEEQARNKVTSIKNLNIPFEVVYTSPLQRAYKVGQIIGEHLNLTVEKLYYAKEFNGYGVLSGMTKDEAKEKYSDQIELLLKTNEVMTDLDQQLDNPEIKIPFVDGAESLYSFARRVKKIQEILENSGKENVILVTHGGIIGSWFRLIMGRKLQKREDCGWILLEGNYGEYTILESNGIE